MKFDVLLNKIKSGNQATITIKGKPRKIVFAASYYTKVYPDAEYIEVFFDDDTILEIVPAIEEVYFCDDSRREISRNLVTDYDEYLRIDGEEFLLTDYNDIQFLKTIHCGDIENGEGKCTFSCYSFADEFWRLAILENSKISDMHFKKVSLSDIDIIL